MPNNANYFVSFNGLAYGPMSIVQADNLQHALDVREESADIVHADERDDCIGGDARALWEQVLAIPTDDNPCIGCPSAGACGPHGC